MSMALTRGSVFRQWKGELSCFVVNDVVFLWMPAAVFWNVSSSWFSETPATHH